MSDAIRKTRDLFAYQPEAWVKEYMTYPRDGLGAGSADLPAPSQYDPDTTCFCLVGALGNFGATPNDYLALAQALKPEMDLGSHTPDEIRAIVIGFNDDDAFCSGDIVQFLDKALAQ